MTRFVSSEVVLRTLWMYRAEVVRFLLAFIERVCVCLNKNEKRAKPPALLHLLLSLLTRKHLLKHPNTLSFSTLFSLILALSPHKLLTSVSMSDCDYFVIYSFGLWRSETMFFPALFIHSVSFLVCFRFQIWTKCHTFL